MSALPLPRNEQQRLREWNQTTRSVSDVSCVHERFEKVAESDPGRIAIVDGAHSITYSDLNKRANQLARYLRRRGIQPGCFVAVLLNRSIDLIVAILAVLKAGAAYIPSDPKYPRERLSVALREAFVPLVVSRSEFGDAVPTFITQLRMDADWDAVAREDGSNLHKLIDAQSLAYVIFTSGSNGKPRGVEVFHSGLSNLVNWHQHEYRITPDDRATLYASSGFDASVWEMWPYLSAGARLHIPDAESHASPVALAKWMAEQGVTISFLPTPVAESFVELDFPEALKLRVLLTGGDRLRHFPSRHLPFRFVNHYGPTEATVVATACDVPASSSLGAPPIGKPISNVHAFVLDREGRPVPIGAKGELYIGGAGIARGYLNQAQLTKEKFVTNPFDGRSGSRLYRTGDLVRYRSDGNLEFHGRIDDQLKIRGFRVEPAEIESVLELYPAVDKSLVIAADNTLGEKTLTAYVVPKKLESGNDPDFVSRLQAEQINEWQQIYEQLYSSNHRER
ncbi:MAG TPA: amino acid adenylation domain-containing protein, partial [Pyrinomonadaceae bacterium]|nr:amino acid adenylation domain-containing protein [Pyrinomonadaceae bacterium]